MEILCYYTVQKCIIPSTFQNAECNGYTKQVFCQCFIWVWHVVSCHKLQNHRNKFLTKINGRKKVKVSKQFRIMHNENLRIFQIIALLVLRKQSVKSGGG